MKYLLMITCAFFISNKTFAQTDSIFMKTMNGVVPIIRRFIDTNRVFPYLVVARLSDQELIDNSTEQPSDSFFYYRFWVDYCEECGAKNPPTALSYLYRNTNRFLYMSEFSLPIIFFRDYDFDLFLDPFYQNPDGQVDNSLDSPTANAKILYLRVNRNTGRCNLSYTK